MDRLNPIRTASVGEPRDPNHACPTSRSLRRVQRFIFWHGLDHHRLTSRSHTLRGYIQKGCADRARAARPQLDACPVLAAGTSYETLFPIADRTSVDAARPVGTDCLLRCATSGRFLAHCIDRGLKSPNGS